MMKLIANPLLFSPQRIALIQTVQSKLSRHRYFVINVFDNALLIQSGCMCRLPKFNYVNQNDCRTIAITDGGINKVSLYDPPTHQAKTIAARRVGLASHR